MTGSGTIRHGAGAGLRFDSTGGHPGYLLGTSEPLEQDFLSQHLTTGSVFYDIGANIGFFSTIAARLVGSAGRVYAFEPYPSSAARAVRNAAMNGFAHVTVVPAAVSNRDGRMTLRVTDSSATHRPATGPEIEVDVIALDPWIAREGARPPTLMMIDVEGAELDVLDGMRETLAAHRPVVCCEVHWLDRRFMEYWRRNLEKLGYTVESLYGGPLPSEGRWHAVLLPGTTPCRGGMASDRSSRMGRGALSSGVRFPDPSAESMWARERDFHDVLARSLDVDALAQHPELDRLDVALFELARDVRGRRVLDAGCGQGDLTLGLLRHGARVTALDLSPAMIAVVDRRARRLPTHSGELRTVAAPLEESNLPAAGFDLVLGKFILHHVDVDSGARELRRVLRPGGRAIFIENSGENRPLTFARDRLAGRWGIVRLGTEDERPLRKADIDNLRDVFERVTTHYPVFEFLVLFDRQVLRFRYPRASRLIRGCDDAVHRFAPPLRRFSYRVIVELEVATASDRGTAKP